MRSRSNRCGACPFSGPGGGGGPGTPNCKTTRLCDAFDVTAIDWLPGKTVREHVEMHRMIDVGQAEAEAYLQSGARVASGELFVAFVQLVHRTIFRRAWGEIAGCLRTEPVQVGGDGPHGFQGAPPAEIDARLRSLWGAHPFPQAHAVGALAMWAATFVQKFFVIHPFRDGNGRTARFLVDVAARDAGMRVKQLLFDSRGKRTRDRRKYIDALQYAHAHLGVTPAGRTLGHVTSSDPLRYLADWWKERIEKADPTELVEEPAEWVDLDWSGELVVEQLDGAFPDAVNDITRWLAVTAEQERARSQQVVLDERVLETVLPVERVASRRMRHPGRQRP